MGGRIPVLDSLSELVLRAEGIPVRLDPLSRLEVLVNDVQAWKESAAKTFLLKNSPFSLLEVKHEGTRQDRLRLRVGKPFDKRANVGFKM